MTPATPAPRSSRPRRPVSVLTALLLAVIGLGLWWAQVKMPPGVTYAQFQTLLEGGQVSRVVVRETTATVDLREPARPAAVSLRLPGGLALPDSPLIAELDRRNVAYRFEAPNQWLGILLNFLPILLLIGIPALFLALLLRWLLRRARRPENLSER